MVSYVAIAAIGTVIGTAIAFHQYFINRPSLFLRINELGDLDHEGQVPLLFSVENEGQRYGEDAYIVLHPDGWAFNFLEVETFDPIFQTGEFSWEEFPPGNPDSDFFELFDEAHQIWVKTPIYRGANQHITMRIAQLDSDETYNMNYWIACQGHPPRSGEFTFDVDADGQISITSDQPHFRSRVRTRIKNQIESYRNFFRV